VIRDRGSEGGSVGGGFDLSHISPLGFFVGPEAERYVKWSYLQ
jgi:hypothetical protein